MASYELRAVTTNYDPGDFGIGDYSVLATGVVDTQFVWSDRDEYTEYLFSIVPVDSLGELGVPSNPAYIPAIDYVGVDDDGVTPERPSRFRFASPNPFVGSTRVVFDLPHDEDIVVTIYSATGSLIRRFPVTRFVAGRNSIRWTGQRENGERARAGVYFVELKSSGMRDSGKILLLR